MQLSAALLLLSATVASALSIESIPAPSVRARAAAAKNSKPRGSKSSCSSLKYDPGEVTYDLPAWDPDTADIYRYRQQQSVNMGSWFVHEQWMVGGIYDCAADPSISEIDIASGTNAKANLEKQWDTFITEDDFAYLQKVGINTVRLPLGFWSLGTNFTKGSIYEDVGDVYENSWPRVLRAIGWASKYGIGVLADLHGAYGSQNGQQHSGVSDGKTNLFTNDNDQKLTIAALVYMTEQLVNVTNVVGIEMLNEPQNADNLPDFYNSAATAMRAVPGAANFPLYLHDGFDITQYADWVGKRTDFCVVDHHSYFVFNSDQQNTAVTDLTSQIKSSVSDSISSATKAARGNLVTDEWGCALADGSTHVSNLQQATQAYCQGQEQVYRNSAAGYAFWSYMMDGCQEGDGNGWCFKGSVGNLLPSTFFSYDSQTSPSGTLGSSGSGNSTSASNSTSSSSNSTSSSSDDSSDDDGSDDDSDDSGSGSAVNGTSTSTSATVSASQAASTGASCQVNTRKRASHSRRRHHQKLIERAQGLNQIRHSQSQNVRRHHRRGKSSSSSSGSGSSSSGSGSGSTTSQGYQDGLAAAQKFAESGSKIGFMQQWISDKGQSGDSYASDFANGVSDGEAAHDKALRRRR